MLVNDFLECGTKNFPNKKALIYNDKRFLYIQIENAANSLANALIDFGLKKQDRSAIYLENSAESVISIFGILKASGVFVVINSQVKAKKLDYILNDCQVKTLITDAKHLKQINNVLSNCPNLKNVIVVDEITNEIQEYRDDENFPKLCSFSNILSDYSNKRPVCQNNEGDLASLIYTSGTTGNPKGVMLTHLNMVSAADSIITYLENTSDDIILNCLPLSFDYGLYQVLMAFKFGGTVVLERSFLYPYQVINLIIKEKVTGFPLVPTIAAILLQLKNLKKYDFSNLRYITNTAQALAPKHITGLQNIFPKTKIYSMYGLTECKRVSYLPPDQISKKPTSVGIPMPNTKVYIIDEKGKRITKPGVIGELVIKGPNVMKGYWNLPKETSKCLKDGEIPGEKILYSGDLFKTDEEGFLYFISRKDDIIKTAGERVSPKEIENVLYALNGVVEAAVVGIPDEILGLAIKAVVSLKKNSNLTGKDIMMHCRKNLENFMVPKVVEFRDKLPKTTTGKISKKELT